jgi:CDGSH-type Zn-finger protein
MTSPIAAQKSPYSIEVKSSQADDWCACGRSKKQLFCDGARAGTSFLATYRPEKMVLLGFRLRAPPEIATR